MRLTAHCIVKNEERFCGYAIRSLIDHVDQVLVFDTGSTDGTVEVLKKLQREYPDKIVLEEKGEADKKRHTALRNEMIERTKTEWFVVLDGDEVWTQRGIEEIQEEIQEGIQCLIVPFYLCVGDIVHASQKGA